MVCAPRPEVRRDSRPGIAPGRCAAGRGGGDDGADKRARGRSETGAGALRGLRRQAPTGGPGASVGAGTSARGRAERRAGEAAEALTGGPGAGRWARRSGGRRAGEAGRWAGCEAGVGIGASWAAGERKRGMGRPGWRTGPGREKGRWERESGLGPVVGFWTGLVWGLGYGFLFYWVFFLLPIAFLFLIQTSLNSNTNLNSNHTQLKVCTSMNATPKIKPMINFNYLRNKN